MTAEKQPEKRSSKAAQQKVIVGIPAYNEDEHIGAVVRRAREHADEVIVVDDGSDDRTAMVAELNGATVIQHQKNKGYGAAIQSIFAAAVTRDADILVTIDADGQHNPDEIPALAKAVKKGYDVVVGSRKMQKHQIPRYRRIGQKVLADMTNLASRTDLSDTESGFRAYSRKALTKLKLRQNGMAVSAEIINTSAARDLRITEVPITISYDEGSSTLHPVVHGFSVMRRVLFMISEGRPLLFFGVIGSVLCLAGIYFGVMAVWALFTLAIMQTGYVLLSILLIILGMLLLNTGLILNVLSHWMRRR